MGHKMDDKTKCHHPIQQKHNGHKLPPLHKTKKKGIPETPKTNHRIEYGNQSSSFCFSFSLLYCCLIFIIQISNKFISQDFVSEKAVFFELLFCFCFSHQMEKHQQLQSHQVYEQEFYNKNNGIGSTFGERGRAYRLRRDFHL